MKIRIGTRNSPLAFWQAEKVKSKLSQLIDNEIVPIQSTGDKNLTQPLYNFPITGIFTKELDTALLNNEINIAVHSLKDIPTIPANGITIAAVLERDYPWDVLVLKNNLENKPIHEMHLLTGSIRRRVFLSELHPGVQFSDLRGNIQTRIEKLLSSDADGAIFSQAALERLKLDINYSELRELIPAPGQGVVAICCRADDATMKDILSKINHPTTFLATTIERKFLSACGGGCSAPIGAYAEVKGEKILLKAKWNKNDGKPSKNFEAVFQMDIWERELQSFLDGIQ